MIYKGPEVGRRSVYAYWYLVVRVRNEYLQVVGGFQVPARDPPSPSRNFRPTLPTG
jgi:hypothetical protein